MDLNPCHAFCHVGQVGTILEHIAANIGDVGAQRIVAGLRSDSNGGRFLGFGAHRSTLRDDEAGHSDAHHQYGAHRRTDDCNG